MKEFLEELINELDTNPRDLTPERIKANRGTGERTSGGGRTLRGNLVERLTTRGLGDTRRKRRNQTVPANVRAEFDEVVSLFDHKFNYFTKGFIAPHSIQELR